MIIGAQILKEKTFVTAAATVMRIQRWDYAGEVLLGGGGESAWMERWGSFPSSSSRGGCAQTQVEDSLRFYLDSAADGVFGGEGGGWRCSPMRRADLSCAEAPPGEGVCARPTPRSAASDGAALSP